MQIYYFLIILISVVIFSHSQYAFSEIPHYSVKTIDIQTKPASAAINENTNQIYVSDFFKSRIIVINASSDEIVDFIPTPKTPFGIGVNSATNMVYVGAEFANILSVINGSSKNTVNIPLIRPYDIAINENSNTVYITGDHSNKVHVLDGETNSIVASMNVTKPCGIAVNSKTGMVYVTSETDNTVHVFDKTNNQVSVIDVESSPRGVSVNEITNIIYVTNQESNTVSVIDGVQNIVTNSIEVEEIPRRITIDSNSNLVYVTNHGTNNITVIDGENNIIIRTIPIPEPFEITINQKTKKLYSMYYGKMGISVIEKIDGNQDVFDLKIISENTDIKSKGNTPLKQFNSGVHPRDILCRNGLELVLKASSLQPACVNPDSITKLVSRGWIQK